MLSHFTCVLVGLLHGLSELNTFEDGLLVAGAMLLRLVVSAYYSQVISTKVRLHLA
jgi:hypothetical protein